MIPQEEVRVPTSLIYYGPQIVAFLLYAITGNYKLGNEFLTTGSHVSPVQRADPPHKVIPDINPTQVVGRELILSHNLLLLKTRKLLIFIGK